MWYIHTMEQHSVSKRKEVLTHAMTWVNLEDDIFFFFFVFFAFSRAAPVAYRGSQATGLIGDVAAGLHHSHSNSNVGSEPHLRPTPQLTATLDP